jgi:signal transduction histidine kinase
VLGLIVAATTILSLFRAARPLRKLTAALESFSETASPVPIAPSGPADLRRLIETVNRMQERLSSLLRGRAMLAGAISHDLRTYLTRLQLRVDAIEDDNERRGAEADIETMTSIVENALAFAQAASTEDLRETVDLAQIIDDEESRSPRQQVNFVIAHRPVLISGDRVALQRVIANLVDNAMHYAGDAEVKLSTGGRFAELVVDDHGKGIPASERETVFEPFYRLENSRNRASGGTGLGLALTRQIVEAHGGRISAGEAPGGGARLRVLLPLA